MVSGFDTYIYRPVMIDQVLYHYSHHSMVFQTSDINKINDLKHIYL